MAGANSSMQMTELDFVNIKTSLVNFLRSQDQFKDYNFAGSGLSTLLDVLTYNTQYNAYYLNMVGNEMFMDTALQRNSVVSHAKLLNYTPRSSVAAEAVIKLTVTGGANNTTVTLPRFASFTSKPVNNKTYNFVNTDAKNATFTNNTAIFDDVIIKQGTPTTQTFIYNSTSNPKSQFEINNPNIDTSTLLVQVYPIPSSQAFDVYTAASSLLELNNESKVYFLEEGTNGNYVIYFGDGVLGKQISDGSQVVFSYLVTQGSESVGANNFTLTTNIGNYTYLVSPKQASSGGLDKETIDSIKFHAPKARAAQNRAVSKEDYMTLVQQNNLGLSFDAVNVWGGQENNPPVYGQVFICLKPSGAYNLTQTQKNLLLEKVLKPISVMTVEPTIVDPDYTYIKINANVVYDTKKTNLTANQIGNLVKTGIKNYASQNLNTFNSTFVAPNLTTTIQSVDPSIVTNEITIQLQKKIYPNLSGPQNYTLNYGTELKKGMFLGGVYSTPSMQFRNPINLSQTIQGVYIEEIPSSSGGLESVNITNPGFGYQYKPIVTVLGDGTGATAEAVLNTNGTIKAINVTNKGQNYTAALITITPAAGDTTGKLGSAIAVLEGQYGTLRLYYNNSTNVKTIFDNNIGTIDYKRGIITLNVFNPLAIDDIFGQLVVTVNPVSTIISSTYNKIITVDDFDSAAITVNVTAKT